MTPEYTPEAQTDYEALFGKQPDWHDETDESQHTELPDLEALHPGATPEDGALSNDEVTYQTLFGK